MRRRDSQRSKVYIFDNDCRQALKGTASYAIMSLPDTIAFVDRVSARLATPRIVVRDGRGTRWARGSYHSVNLPKWSRHPVVILHEIAHVMVERYESGLCAYHGPEFVRHYSALLALFTPLTASQIRSMRTARKIKVAKVAACRPIPLARDAKRLCELREQIDSHRSAARELERELRELGRKVRGKGEG